MSLGFRLCIIICLIIKISFAQLNEPNKLSVDQLRKKAELYLLKDKSLRNYFSIDADGISMYENPEGKKNNKPEFFLSTIDFKTFQTRLRECSSKELIDIYKKGHFSSDTLCSYVFPISNRLNKIDTLHPLKDLKIAIDPGHIAGNMDMGEIEKKCLSFCCKDSTGKVDSIAIAEGELTYATAVLLKVKLEAAGATVMLTRPFNNASAFGVTFDSWLKTDYLKTVDSLFEIGKISKEQQVFFKGSKPSRRDKFRVIFKDVELSKRAEVINDFHPDFSVVIHYNVDETNTGWNNPTRKNYNMTFVGGAFMQNDLNSPEKRFTFLRMLVSEDLENSIALSASVVKEFERGLDVKTASSKDAQYLTEGCLPTSEPGVFCRNLQLTRYICGPLVYGETLYQDNINECVLLNKEQDKIKNKRIQQVAEAYYKGVLDFAKKFITR